MDRKSDEKLKCRVTSSKSVIDIGRSVNLSLFLEHTSLKITITYSPQKPKKSVLISWGLLRVSVQGIPNKFPNRFTVQDFYLYFSCWAQPNIPKSHSTDELSLSTTDMSTMKD